MHRESLGATAIVRGVAVPQAQTDLIDVIELSAGRYVRPVPWPGAMDGQPVEFVYLAVFPDSSEALRKMLEVVASQLRAIQGA